MQLDDLKLIHELSLKISSVLEMPRLLPIVMDAFVRAGKISRGSIMMFDERTGRLIIKASVGLSERAVNEVMPALGEGVAGMAADTKKPVLIMNTRQDPRYKRFAEDPGRSLPEESLLCLPIIFKEKVFGIINLQSKADGKPFNEEDETMLFILANAAAVAINNARLYELVVEDELTGLYVKKYFLSRLDSELGRAKRHFRYTSLIMGEVDNIDVISRRHGKELSDKILKKAADIIKNEVRNADICARYDDTKFAIILIETDGPSALLFAERLIEKIRSVTVHHGDISVNISASLGIAMSTPKKFLDAPALVASTIKALDKAKSQGGNKTVLDHE